MNTVISITVPEALGVLEDICEELALPMNLTFRGRGTAVQSMLDVLGIESNEKRVVITTASEEKTKLLMEAQRQRLHIGVPGHGIAIAVPVKSIGGGKTVAILTGEENQPTKSAPPEEFAYELILVIANEGQTDLVMNAARSVGARGGTVLHGKGTGAVSDPKFRNISIATEKEVILIVSKTEDKANIMREILKKAGPDTPAKAITFSLPVTEVAGFGFFNQ